MVKKLVICGLLILLPAGLILAHGNATHLMGTVTALSKDTITIQDKAGKSTVVSLEKTTKYLRGKKPAAADEVKTGIRVVIDAQMNQKTKMYVAEEIQLGVTEAAAAPASKK